MISLLLSLSQIWPVGFLLTDSFDLLPNRHGYFYTSLLFGTTKCSRLILHFSWSIPEISHFFEGFLVNWSKNGIWKARTWLKIAHCCCVWLILGPLSRQEIRNIQVCIYIYTHTYQFSSVQSLSGVRLFVTPWIAARQASLSITNSRSSLKLMSIESVILSSHFILCHPLFFPPPLLPPSESFPMSQLFAWGGQKFQL